MGLFDPAWKTEDRSKLEKALASVQKTKKPVDLMKIALTAPLEAVQLAAVERLDDEELLKEIARSDTTNKYSSPIFICVKRKTREKAVDKIHSQELLYEIVTTASEHYTDGKHIALYSQSRLTDQVLLKKAALSEKGSWQFAAAGKIKDEKVLAEIVEKAPTRDTARIAAAGIGDFDFLLDLFLKLSSNNSNYGWCVREQMNYLLNPPEYFIVDPHKHDRIEIVINNFGCMEFHRHKPNAPVTAEQRARYVETVIQTKAAVDLSPFTNEELERILWGSPSKDNREEIQWKLLDDPDYPPERLWNALKSPHFPGGWRHSHAREVLKKIEARIREVNDPEILLQWIKDPETEPHFAAKCLKVLYTQDWAGKIKWSNNRGISAVQDEAVRALLNNLPEDDLWVRSYCLTMIVKLIPKGMAEAYGITFSESERDDEDQFGRYTYSQTMLRFGNRTVDYYNGID